MKIIDIALICHEANRALCNNFGDTSQVDWFSAPEWQRESAIKGVQFALDNPGAGPSAQHDAWSKDKIDAGWVYGEVKDPNATPPTHPCLVPFDQLPVHQQAKDHLFKGICKVLLPFTQEWQNRGPQIGDGDLTILPDGTKRAGIA